MRLWRLSSVRHARDFTGGYGLSNNGRWNTVGRAVTYCATVPSLAALEKRVHVTDAADLPRRAMNGWLKSPEHLANIVSGKFTETGGGIAQSADGRTYVTQDFVH